jgi:hypothetical protein
MTDQGSTRDSVSIAWRLGDLRVLMPLVEPRFCQAEVTELARPAAAPPTAEADPEENPLADEGYPAPGRVAVPVPLAGAGPDGAGPAGVECGAEEGAEGAEEAGFDPAPVDQSERE